MQADHFAHATKEANGVEKKENHCSNRRGHGLAFKEQKRKATEGERKIATAKLITSAPFTPFVTKI